MRSDQIDSPIIKEFEKAALRLLSTAPNVTPATGFDTATKTVLRGQVSIQAHYPPELAIKMDVRRRTVQCLEYAESGGGSSTGEEPGRIQKLGRSGFGWGPPL